MILNVDLASEVPIYQQIRDRIVEAIAAGDAPVGTGLPATRQLAVDLGINFHTVNKGYDLLRQEGLLRIGRRAGAVVQRDATSGPPRPDWAQDWAVRLRTMLAEATAQGLPSEEIIRHCRDVVAGFPAATDDGPARGDAA
jgi:GntR family transcriptional regulator